MSWTKCTLLGALLGLSQTGPANAARADAQEHDVYLTMQARALFAGDELLGRLNLGVVVKDRVGVLWGPVPTAGLSMRAETLLRSMLELSEVRNELFVDGDAALNLGGAPVPPMLPRYLPESVPAPVRPQPRPRLPERFRDLELPSPEITSRRLAHLHA